MWSKKLTCCVLNNDMHFCTSVSGPKLYKEPSFKSNKFIIHNAISRCCLAGKVNEPQKTKIVEVSDLSVSLFSTLWALMTDCRQPTHICMGHLNAWCNGLFICISFLSAKGNGEKLCKPFPHSVPGCQLSIPGSLHHEPRDGGDGSAHRFRAARYQSHYGRVYLQVQLWPQAVYGHPVQDHVHECGCLHHSQPPVGAQAPRNPKEARDPKIKPAGNANYAWAGHVTLGFCPHSGRVAGHSGVHAWRRSGITKNRP